MFIYVVIAFELAILYTVFWYVYQREPKPYKIIGDPWGKYDDSGFTTGGADPMLPLVSGPRCSERQWWSANEF